MNPTARSTSLGASHLPLRQAVLDELRQAIIAGRFPQGVRLLEEELADELDVSRNPVREALQALAVEGFVELEPRRGARVAVVSEDKARDLFDVRGALEGLVAELAATRRTPTEMSALQALVRDGLAASAAGDLDPLPELNTRFHRTMAAAARNRLLEDSLGRLTHLIQWVYARRIDLRREQSWYEHERIVAAIDAGDPIEARQQALAHIARAREAYFDGRSVPAA